MKRTPFHAAFAAFLALFAGTAPAAVPPAPKPGLWKLADADTTIYLFGTIHALPAGYQWQNERLETAFAEADRLVIEALIDPNPAASAALLLELGTSPGLPPLADRVKPKQRAKLAKLIADSKMPAGLLDGLETWAAALILGTGTIATLGVSREAGVEEGLKALFTGASKPIEAFETPRAQLGFFDALSEADQRAFLSGVIEEPKDARAVFGKMLAAWARGDDKAIARAFDAETKASPALFAALMGKRNATWADALVERLERPGTTLVAVGAGHLAGRGSVQDVLARRGYRVERIQ